MVTTHDAIGHSHRSRDPLPRLAANLPPQTCSNLFTWGPPIAPFTHIGTPQPEPPSGHVQTCSLHSADISPRAGSWHLAEMPSGKHNLQKIPK